MTLSPSTMLGTRLSIAIGEYVGYELANCCAVPGCTDWPEHGAHHIVRRSDTAGPRDWVVIDGLVYPNKCRLCSKHHRWVTGGIGGHLARIVWQDTPQGHWRYWVSPRMVMGEPTLVSDGKSLWVDRGPLRGIEGMYSEEEY